MRFGPNAAETISVILARPQTPENIGLVARAMKNTGFADLRLVLDGPLPSTALVTAVHAEDILGGARLFSSVGESVSDLEVVFRRVPWAESGLISNIITRMCWLLLCKT